MYACMYVYMYIYILIFIQIQQQSFFFAEPPVCFDVFSSFHFPVFLQQRGVFKEESMDGYGSWVGWDTLTVSTRIEIFIFKHVVLHIHTVATVFHLFRISEIT